MVKKRQISNGAEDFGIKEIFKNYFNDGSQKNIMIKLLVDSVISTGKILKQLKYFSFNKIFIHRFINRLLHTNRYKDL